MVFNALRESYGYGVKDYIGDCEFVSESPYDLGMDGALMHIAESEDNYNRLMTVVGLSEMRYMQETGMDLMLNESGAVKSFIEKAKEFFISIGKKVLSIFNTFMTKIGALYKNDTDFIAMVKKRKVSDADLSKLKLKGYNFQETLRQSEPTIPGFSPEEVKARFSDKANTVDEEDGARKYETGVGGSFHDKSSANKYTTVAKTDANFKNIDEDVDKAIKEYRGYILGKGSNDRYDMNEYKSALKAKLYGELKENLGSVYSVNDMIEIVSGFKKAKEGATKIKDSFKDAINKTIQGFDKQKGEFKEDNEYNRNVLKLLNACIKYSKAASASAMMYYSEYLKALTTEYKQAKKFLVAACGKVSNN